MPRAGTRGRPALRVMLVLLMLPVTGTAQEVVAVSPANTSSSAATARLLTPAYHWLGTGIFQCDGIPCAMDINPAGTALIAYGAFLNRPLSRFSIPDGAGIPIPDDPSGAPDATPYGGVHWIDDQRVVVSAESIICTGTVTGSDQGFSWSMVSYYGEVLQVVDTRSGTRTTFELPMNASAASFILTHDGRFAIFPCPMPPIWCAAIDAERPRSHLAAEGMGFLDLSNGSLRRGFCPLPLDQRFVCTSYAISGDDRFLAMLVHATAADGDSNGSLIQWWDVAHDTLLRSFPIPSYRLLCDLRFSADDELEFLYTDPANPLIPLTTTMSLTTGRLRDHSGWAIRDDHAMSPRVLATIGPAALTLSDHRSILLHDHGRPAPLGWYDLAASAPSINGHITCSRRGRFYAIAYGDCINLIDLTHAWMRPQPDAAWSSAPRWCRFLDDGALVVTTNAQVAIEHADGSQRLGTTPLDLDWSTAGGYAGSLLVAKIRKEIDPSQHSVVWDARTRSIVRRLDQEVIDSIHISPHQGWCCYRQHGGRFVLADLRHAERPESIIGAEDPQVAYENVYWSDDERTLCLTRSVRSALTNARSFTDASAWDCQSGRRRWLPCTGAGVDLVDIADLIPSADGGLVLAIQGTQRPVPELTIPPLLRLPDLVTSSDFPTLLLDGRDGHLLRALDYPGHGRGFTPDGTRIVGNQCVVRVADNRRLMEIPQAQLQDQYFDPSPSRTWLAVGRGRQIEAIVDSAGAGIVLPLPMHALPEPVDGFFLLTWNPGEDRLAVTAPTVARVLVVDLYPSPPPASDLHAAQAQLDAGQGWLLAACALARCGEPAVSLLQALPPTAHRIIALERCAAAGSRSALATLATQRALPGALGLLAADAWARQQRSLRTSALAHAELGTPAP